MLLDLLASQEISHNAGRIAALIYEQLGYQFYKQLGYYQFKPFIEDIEGQGKVVIKSVNHFQLEINLP